MTAKELNRKRAVLVGVLKSPRDLAILKFEHWYRVPASKMPKRDFKYLAFYQPAAFARAGNAIRYWSKVLNREVVRRKKLLPAEKGHPRAEVNYYKIFVGPLKKLTRPIRNIPPRRVVFGFTTLADLKRSRTVFELFKILPIEQMVGQGLAWQRIEAIPQFPVVACEKHYVLDFAVLDKKVGIECDNKASHSTPAQRRRDQVRDRLLRRCGWRIVHLSEDKIIYDLENCLKKVRLALKK